MNRQMLIVRWIGIGVLLNAFICTGGCLARASEEEPEISSGLVVGTVSLELFPVITSGIDSLSYYCRIYYECGCPLLSPEDIEWCREDVWYLTDDECQSVVLNAVPECIGD